MGRGGRLRKTARRRLATAGARGTLGRDAGYRMMASPRRTTLPSHTASSVFGS